MKVDTVKQRTNIKAKSAFVSLSGTLLIFSIVFHLLPIEQTILKFIVSSFLFFAFTFFLNYYTPFRKWNLFWLAFIPAFSLEVIGAIMSRGELIPWRFPFYLVFLFCGIACAILLLSYRRVYTWSAILGSLLFFSISYFYFFPLLVWYGTIIHKPKVDNEVLLGKFATIIDTTNHLNLADTAHCKVKLIEFYFVGCAPCELKYNALKKLRYQFSKTDLDIIMICNGGATTRNDFVEHAKKNKENGIVFLYDKGGLVTKNKLGSKGFPTEILVKRDKIKQTIAGFSKETEKEYLNNEVLEIKKMLNDD